MSSPLTQILNSINKKTELLEKEFIQSNYVPFIVNRGMSYFTDTVLLANEMNKHSGCPKELQYEYYYHSVNKKSRFSKWHKPEKDDLIQLIMEAEGYSFEKAKDVAPLYTKDEIVKLKQKVYKGGIS